MVWKQVQSEIRQENGTTNTMLQGSPESGRLWEEHCNRTLMAPPLNFTTTTHDKTICRTMYKGEQIFMLHQVDHFAMACDNEKTAKEIYNIILEQASACPRKTKTYLRTLDS